MIEKTILCIDDSKLIRNILNSLFSKKHNVVLAENGEDGLDKLKDIYNNNDKVNLIIVDINMPVMSGPEFIQTIQTLSKYKLIPIIVLTGDESSLDDFNFKYEDWHKKPFDKKLLIQSVEKILSPLEYLKSKLNKLDSVK